MCLPCSRNTICKNRDIETLEKRLQMRCNYSCLAFAIGNRASTHTFIGKELLLRGVHVINAIERETKFLCLVLGIGYSDNVHCLSITAAFRTDNCVFIQLLVKERSNSCYHCKLVSAAHGAHCEWRRYLPRTDIAGQLGDIRKTKW